MESKELDENEDAQAAIAEALAIRRKLDVETRRQRDLELTIEDLQKELAEEKAKQPTTSWEEETVSILDTIRAECDAIFETNTRSLRSSNKRRGSPKSVVFAVDMPSFESETKTTRPLHVRDIDAPLRTGFNSTTPKSHNRSIFPSNSYGSSLRDLDRALDETEALVRSLC